MGPYFIVESRLIHVNVRIIATIIHIHRMLVSSFAFRKYSFFILSAVIFRSCSKYKETAHKESETERVRCIHPTFTFYYTRRRYTD